MAHIIGPVALQEDLKKPLLNPSGPGDLWLGIEKKASLMSKSENGLQMSICCSWDKISPWDMMDASIGCQ